MFFKDTYSKKLRVDFQDSEEEFISDSKSILHLNPIKIELILKTLKTNLIRYLITEKSSKNN